MTEEAKMIVEEKLKRWDKGFYDILNNKGFNMKGFDYCYILGVIDAYDVKLYNKIWTIGFEDARKKKCNKLLYHLSTYRKGQHDYIQSKKIITLYGKEYHDNYLLNKYGD